MENKNPDQRSQGKRRGSMGTFWFLVTALLLITVALPSIIIVGVGMLPSIVAYIVDNSKEKYAALSVSSMNFCGVFPALYNIWTGSHSFDGAISTLSDPFTLMIMYSAAGFGWLFFMSIPTIVSTFLTVMAQHRISHLRGIQKHIIAEWGEEVSQPPGH
ncbi:MAG: hypothetical protein OEY85_04645 [Rhodospirillales bacterium]|nr:hypothetical protein [Rhodospirillales bacterium]